jgi:hypothetical protein
MMVLCSMYAPPQISFGASIFNENEMMERNNKNSFNAYARALTYIIL